MITHENEENKTRHDQEEDRKEHKSKHNKKNAIERNSSTEEKKIKMKMLIFCAFFIIYVSGIYITSQWFVENYTNYTKSYNIIFTEQNLFIFALNCLREYYNTRDTKILELPISEMMKNIFNSTEYNFEQIKVS